MGKIGEAGGGVQRPGRAYLGLGSNVGDRVSHLAHGVKRLGELGEVAALSGVWETAPVGYLDQPAFLNMVVALDPALAPAPLLEAARRIEEERGRERTFRNAPRTLDIDLLLYGDRRVEAPGLTVPHPRMGERAFVLIPLLEVAPELEEPGTGRRYARYLAELGDATAGADEPRRIMDGEELLHGEG